MKKLFFLAAIVIVSKAAFAQFGLTGGVTIATVKLEQSISGVSISSKAGFTLGIFNNFMLSPNFSFRPGLNFTQKGAKATETGGTTKTELKRTINDLEVPLDFIYNASGGFFIGVGPALAYALSGKDKFSDGSPETKLKIGSNASDDLKPFEFSGNVLAGYLFANIFFCVNYNLGLSNLSPSTDKAEHFKSRYFGIRLGYLLGKPVSRKK